MPLFFQILMNVFWTLTHVIASMRTALILMAAIHVPVMLASLEMEKYAVRTIYALEYDPCTSAF